MAGFSYEDLEKEFLEARLWELMRSRAKRTDNMGAVLWEGPANLRAQRKKTSSFLKEVPKDRDFLFKVRLERDGYLILLQREPNGTIYCLCPSEYAVEWRLPAGEVTLPQPGSPHATFGADELGWEQWLAIASLESPPFAWLEDSKHEAVELDGDRLHQLWQYVDSNPDCELMYAEYQVVNNQGETSGYVPVIVSPEGAEVEEIDPDDTPVEEVKASLRRALQDVKEGKTWPVSELWEGIDAE